MSAVVFDPDDFKLQYPEFNQIESGVLGRCFDQAEILLNNTNSSIVKSEKERKTLLYLLVAHIATLLHGKDGKGGAELVGAISSASEGTVSVSTNQAGINFNNAWYQQTQYGSTYWAMTAKYRTFRYVPGRSTPEVTRFFNGFIR